MPKDQQEQLVIRVTLEQQVMLDHKVTLVIQDQQAQMEATEIKVKKVQQLSLIHI